MSQRQLDPSECAELVARLGTDEWQTAYDRLDAHLDAAGPDRVQETLDIVVDGFDHDRPQVRKWCVALLDHHATSACLDPLAAMLEDPKAPVRRHAVHSVGCQSCKDEPVDLDVVGLLIERVETDPSVRVRRVATHMLGNQPPDERAGAFLADLAESADDEKLRRNARWARDQHDVA